MQNIVVVQAVSFWRNAPAAAFLEPS